MPYTKTLDDPSDFFIPMLVCKLTRLYSGAKTRLNAMDVVYSRHCVVEIFLQKELPLSMMPSKPTSAWIYWESITASCIWGPGCWRYPDSYQFTSISILSSTDNATLEDTKSCCDTVESSNHLGHTSYKSRRLLSSAAIYISFSFTGQALVRKVRWLEHEAVIRKLCTTTDYQVCREYFGHFVIKLYKYLK